MLLSGHSADMILSEPTKYRPEARTMTRSMFSVEGRRYLDSPPLLALKSSLAST
jgi:hypothetical protein